MRKNGLPFCAICSRNIQKRRANCGGVAEGAKPARFAVLPRPQSKTCGAGSGGRANFPASEFQEYLPAGSSGALSGRCQSAGFLLMPLCAQAKTKKWICPQKRPPLPYMPPGMVLGPIYLIDKGRRRKRVWRKEGVCVGRPERRRSTQMQNCFSSREIASNFWPSRTYGLRLLASMRASLAARLLPGLAGFPSLCLLHALPAFQTACMTASSPIMTTA